MSKPKIYINRPEPTSEQIKPYKDFGGLVNKHRKLTKRPLYYQKRLWWVILFILILVYLIFVAV